MRSKRSGRDLKVPKRKSSALSYTTIFKGLVVGVCAGVVVTAYRFFLNAVTKITFPLYGEMSKNPLTILAVFVVLAVCGLIIGFFIKKEPMIMGSGIPQVRGVLIGKMKFRWLRVLILKFIGGIISLGAGLSLGREGPSVQLGAAAGLGVAEAAGGNPSKQKILLTYGAAAGLSAAFNAPLAGVCFALEELHKSISKYVFIGAALASVTADLTAKLVFGSKPVFDIAARPSLPLRQYYYIIILGIILGIMGVVFNNAILNSVNKYDNIMSKMPVEVKPVIPFIFAGIIGFCFPMLLGGGNEFVEKLWSENFSVSFLIALLFIKFVFTMVSYSGSAPGGIFLPLLSIGAALGCITGKLFVLFGGLDEQFVNTFIILAMAGYFTAVVKSPLTGMVLLSEMSGGFQGFLMFLTVCITAYIVSDLLKGQPVYEMLLKNSLRKNKNLEENTADAIVNITIKVGTYTVGTMFRNLIIPDYINIVSVSRYGEHIKITDNLRIAVGDVITVKTTENSIEDVIEFFERPKRR